MWDYFGLVFMEGTWLYVAIAFMIIGLIIHGYTNDSFDDGMILLECMVIIIASVFWPIVLLLCLVVGLVCIPLFVGKYTKKFKIKIKEEKERKKKEKLMNLSDVEKVKVNEKEWK